MDGWFSLEPHRGQASDALVEIRVDPGTPPAGDVPRRPRTAVPSERARRHLSSFKRRELRQSLQGSVRSPPPSQGADLGRAQGCRPGSARPARSTTTGVGSSSSPSDAVQPFCSADLYQAISEEEVQSAWDELEVRAAAAEAHLKRMKQRSALQRSLSCSRSFSSSSFEDEAADLIYGVSSWRSESSCGTGNGES